MTMVIYRMDKSSGFKGKYIEPCDLTIVHKSTWVQNLKK